ncbi:MAG: hypothetical protein E7454_08075 [Ruminococcaceae bacterium]|nr:hypothetical protein [Oscillospiraceae bacterium]
MNHFSTVAFFSIFAVLTAIAGTVLAYIFIIPEKKRAGLNKIFGLLHDIFNFKFLIIEKVLQALYVFSTLAVFLYGVFMLFGFDFWTNYRGETEVVWHGGYGLLIAIVGPIVIRLAYEGTLMLILLVKNVIQINGKLKNANEDAKEDLFAVPEFPKKAEAPAAEAPKAPEAPAAPAAPVRFCTNCGSMLNADGSCPNCK